MYHVFVTKNNRLVFIEEHYVLETVLNLAESGETVPYIAEHMKLTPVKVRNILRRAGSPIKEGNWAKLTPQQQEAA